MRFLAVGNNEFGFISIGQFATGVIALGQVARGGIAIGQGAVGLIAIGQGALGIFYATGMVGIAGRKGWGLGVPLIPSVDAPRAPPAATSLAALGANASATGWLAATLGTDSDGVGLFEGGKRLPVKLDRHLVSPAKELVASGTTTVLADTRTEGGRLVTNRLVFVPERSWRRKGFFSLAGFQAAGLVGLGIAFWPLAGNDILAGIRPTPAAHHSSPAPPPPPPRARPNGGRPRGGH